jgi:hypothetical protein
MKTFIHFLLIIIFSALFSSCQRPISSEAELPSAGSLSKDINGNCKPVIISGSYIVGQNLADSNFLEVEVTVTFPGTYTISTDTINGYYFKASGTFTTTGIFPTKLTAFGTPIISDTDQFTITYNSSICEASVRVNNNINQPALFTFDGEPNICLNNTVYGSYVKNILLDTSSKVKISLNVTNPGTYSIATNTTNGYSFSATGTFSFAGVQTVLLTASGKPINSGTDLFTVTAQNSSCNFNVNVLVPVAVNSNDYYPLTTNSYWTYDDLVHPGDTIKRTIADTITLDSILYKVIREDAKFGGPYQYFIRKEGFNYLEYAAPNKFTTFFQYKNPVYGEIPFLKENLTSGAVWSSPEYIDTASDGNVFTIRYDFTCTDANATVTLNGKAFANVYKISMLPLVKLTGNPFEDTNEAYLFYYAKGVGLIYMKKTLSGFIQTEWRIRNWQVN